MEFIVDSMQESYVNIVKYVAAAGVEKSPRGLPTRDVPGAQIVLRDPTRAIPAFTGRALSLQLAAVEALSLIGGFCDPALLVAAAPEMSKFMDGGNFHGGYGQRTRGQMVTVIDRLLTDPDTRQAQVVLWDPSLDALVSDARDYPCTTSIQFLSYKTSVGRFLDCHVHMRSNDVWRGLSLDMFMFTQLQLAVTGFLGWQVGTYYHHATSLHMYETDMSLAKNIHEPTQEFSMGSLLEKSSTHQTAHDAWLSITKTIRDDVRVCATAGEDGYYSNGYNNPYDFNAPTLAWYTDRLLAARGKL